MTAAAETKPEVAAEARPSKSPGALVRQARERARMSLEELAAATKLARVQIEALEKDDFSALLEPVYVRGYYRKCAKILNIPDRELFDAYQDRVAPKRAEAPAKLRLAPGTDIGAGPRLPLPMAIAAAVVAVILCVFLWNIFRAPAAPAPILTQSEPLAEPAPAPSALPETVPVEAPVSETIPSTTEAAPAAVAPAESAPAPDATPPPTSAPAVLPNAAQSAAVPVTPTAATGTLTLNIVITSWVRVDDAGGKTLINGLMRTGDLRTLSGVPPFAIFLGNGPGVRVELDGKPVDFSRFIAENLTARFKAPQ